MTEAIVDTSRRNRMMVGSRGNSSVGRARPCQGRGREFESRFPLHFSSAKAGAATPPRRKTSARRGFLFFAEGVATLSQAIDAEAGWQSGHAAACKAVYAGSIPTLAST